MVKHPQVGSQTNNRTQTELAEWHKLSLDNMTLAQKIWPYTAQTLTAIPHHSPHEALIQLLSAIWPFIMRLVPIQASHPRVPVADLVDLLLVPTPLYLHSNTSRGPSTTDLLSSHQVPHINISSHLMSELKSSIQSLCLIPVSELPSIWLDLPVLTHVSLH